MDKAREIEINSNFTLFLANNIKTRQEKLYVCFLLAVKAREGLISILGRKKAYESLCKISDKVIE